jgi:DNA repair protein RadC
MRLFKPPLVLWHRLRFLLASDIQVIRPFATAYPKVGQGRNENSFIAVIDQVSQSDAALHRRIALIYTMTLPSAFEPLTQSRTETAIALFLDGEGNLLSTQHHASNRTDSVDVSIRSIVIMALQVDARFLLLAHSHPSNRLEPSRQDLTFTRKLFMTLDGIGVRLLDHFIVCPTGWTSFQERGLL